MARATRPVAPRTSFTHPVTLSELEDRDVGLAAYGEAPEALGGAEAPSPDSPCTS